MSGETILVVDDEKNIAELAELYLQNAGYKVEWISDGAQALERILRQPPDLVILDLLLPGLDGWEVCKRVRAKSDVPIIMLTALTDDVDKIIGLELGADDYLTKPFNPRELLARVKAILRRSTRVPETEESRPVTLGDVVVDPARHEVTVAGKPIALRAKEFELLQTLAEHRGLVLTREQLLNLVWGFDFYGQTRTVDVHVGHLRNKLAGSKIEIETIWGVGYKLVINE